MKKAIVFGAGARFRYFAEEMKSKYDVLAVFDNNEELQGLVCCGCPVRGSEIFSSLDYDCVLVPTVKKREMIKELVQRGVPEGKIVPWYPEGGHEWKHWRVWSEGNVLQANFDGLRFAVRHSSDECVLQEVFLHNCYSFYAGEESFILFDIGMNVGLASLYFLHYPQTEHVYAFEPFRETYEQALANFSLNDETLQNRITAYNFALSDYAGTETFSYVGDFTGGMRIANGATHVEAGTENAATIEIKDAAEILRPLLAKHSDRKIIMKIDCEGSEYKIFQSMEKAGILDHVQVFLMETHDDRENELKSILRKHGYLYFDQYRGNPGGCGMLYAYKM